MKMFGRRAGEGRCDAQIYERVSGSSKDAQEEESKRAEMRRNERERRKRKQESIESINNKIHAFLWVTFDVVLLYLTNFWTVCFNDSRVNRSFFNIGIVCSGIFTCLILYAAVWMPYVKRVTMDVQIYSPRLIPTATVFGVIASLGFIVGLWPVFGLFTPAILGINFFSAVMATHFLPAI